MLLPFLALLPITATFQQSDDPKLIGAAVNSAAKTFMENGQTIGLSIGIFKDGNRYFYNFGSTEFGGSKPPTSHACFFIASITKTFTGILLAKAAVEKKLNLDDDVRKYLQGSYPNLEFEGQPIRLWQLVDHVSGLPFNFPERVEPWTLPGYDAARGSVKESAEIAAYTKQQFLRDLHKVKLTRVPGVKFSYSNAAAQLAGLVLERVYRKPYESILRDKITGPLGMSDTKVNLTPEEISLLPRGHSEGGSLLPAVSNRFPAAGSLKSTTEDMIKYMAWNIAETDESVKIAHRAPSDTNWGPGFYVGLNWQILKSGEIRDIFQDGNVPGFHSMCVVYPELHLGMIVLTNEQVKERPAQLSPLIDGILKKIDPRALTTP